ncbi:alpha/beta hydrolase [Phototrophicus methaneseepsis]|uniref:Alpha/beta hydrolase n=1 Tax=Phototrophicus methaneseepsis TaxID=2710758 RepID=A0A7S8EAL1_9CHLR|nr:alpha/beta hydrolase [Phototrophicus methaneseepsis]QPC83411.1 alpha/beta hydrolase [Phototrophicus methaneseepsis]
MAKEISRLLKVAALYALGQQAFALGYLASRDVKATISQSRNLASSKALLHEQTVRYESYTVHHRIENGIERITYTPHERRYETPIIMQHGMWHGAWCWDAWQALLATWGWESHAHSLPGHARSLPQRPIWLCTLDYYLRFLMDEIERMPHKPILMGHSMGGALAQWYLKYVGDDLPAVVLVAPWTARSSFYEGLPLLVKRDPLVVPLTSLEWSAGNWVRSPRHAAEALITENARMTPEELHACLDNESALAVYQHNPPFWYPPHNVRTPMLLLSGERDAVCSLQGHRSTAALYGATHAVIPNSGHNLMTEASYRHSAEIIHDWLFTQEIG